MKIKTVLFSVSLVLLGSLGTLALTSFSSQEQGSRPSVPRPSPEEMKKIMEAYMKAAVPGPEHKKLAEGAGEWVWETKTYMGPGSPATKTSMKVHSRMLLGGRFLMEEVEGKLMGQVFQGISITGYDKVRKGYQNLWMDSMGTMMTYSFGKEKVKGEIHFSGTMVDPMTPKGRPFRSVLRHRGKDSHSFELYDSLPGTKQEFLVMSVSAKRVK